MTDQSTLATRREQLEGERSRLLAQLASLEAGSTTAPEFDDNFADSAQVAAEQGENKSLAGQLREQLEDVEHALAKVDDGSYGTCEVCGQPIAGPRLEAMPATRFCIDHA